MNEIDQKIISYYFHEKYSPSEILKILNYKIKLTTIKQTIAKSEMIIENYSFLIIPSKMNY